MFIRFMDKSVGDYKPECLEEIQVPEGFVVIYDQQHKVIAFSGDPIPVPPGTTHIEFVLEE